MLIDVAKRAGIEIGFCSPETAQQYDIVLVSLTSIYDCLAFYQQCYRLKSWRINRKFRVLCGGFGMQNPFALLDIVDEFWFGRCENEFVEWILNEDFEHPSLMKATAPKVCKINQVDKFYENGVQLHTNAHGDGLFYEKLIGCPNGCFFCHYTWSRKYVRNGEHYQLNLYKNTNSIELDMFNINDFNPKATKVTIGLDGLSERLRYCANKHISNELVEDVLRKIRERSEIVGKAVFVTLYNIDGYEGQDESDLKEFLSLLRNFSPKKKRLVIIIHTTPLHPSPATPMVFSAVNLHTKLCEYRGKEIDNVNSNERKHCTYSQYSSGNNSLLESLVIERFTEQYRTLLNTLCFNSKYKSLKSLDKITFCEDNFDLNDLVREYDVEEQVPSWCCESYVGWDAIKKMRKFMIKKQIEYGLR